MRKSADPYSLNGLLATTVRQLRNQKGLSQEELASLASVDRTYISGIERARRNITISTLERLIPHLTTNAESFFKSLCEHIHQAESTRRTRVLTATVVLDDSTNSEETQTKAALSGQN